MRTEKFVDNTVNNLRYKIKFEKCVKDIAKHCFSLLNKNRFYSWRHIIFKIPKSLITSAFFFGEADTKKHRYALVKASNTALVKLAD